MERWIVDRWCVGIQETKLARMNSSAPRVRGGERVLGKKGKAEEPQGYVEEKQAWLGGPGSRDPGPRQTTTVLHTCALWATPLSQ